jgi:hypothetical protein
MSLWKITTGGPVKVTVAKPKAEKLLEEQLEDWVLADPSLLGERLLIIGRQVFIPGVNERLDLLALDPQGRAVVIELKRGDLKAPVDMQALRYASYLSKWGFGDFEKQARSFLGNGHGFNFNELYEQFCEAYGEEVPTINSDQRIILVGSEVREKLGSVALWLHEHNIKIKVVEVEVYREGDLYFVRPDIIIPLPVSRFSETGTAPTGDVSQPWVQNRKDWHLSQRCSSMTREIFQKLNSLVQDNLDVDGPRWDQKFYVAYRIGNNIWLAINTRSSVLRLSFHVKANSFKAEELAERLGVKLFDKEESFTEKLNLPSSLFVRNQNETADRVILRIKEDFDLNSTSFLEFLRQAYKTFPK